MLIGGDSVEVEVAKNRITGTVYEVAGSTYSNGMLKGRVLVKAPNTSKWENFEAV